IASSTARRCLMTRMIPVVSAFRRTVEYDSCPTEADGDVVVRIVVARETAPGERRVALVPESCKKLIQAGYEIAIESGAGDAAGFLNQQYSAAGASLISDSTSF